MAVAAVTALCLGLSPMLAGHGVFLFYLLPLLWIGWRYTSGPFLVGTVASVIAGLVLVSFRCSAELQSRA